MLKAKYDILYVFPAFTKMIETQFSKTIKSVRIDNALELNFGTLFKDKGILALKPLNKTQ